MRRAVVIAAAVMLSGCAGYITEARQLDAALKTGADEAYSAIIDLGCNKTPIGTLARAVEARGDDYAYARYLTCPSVRTLVEAVNRRVGE